MSRKKLITIIIGLVMSSSLLFSFTGKIYAFRGSGSSKPAMKRPHPIVLPSPRPTIFIEYKWSPKDVVKIFNENNLSIEKTEPVTKEYYMSLPAKAKEAIRFTMPSIGEKATGCILSFEVKNHYLEKNKKEELYSWSFTKDNVVVVLNGVISEEKARQFERALNGLN